MVDKPELRMKEYRWISEVSVLRHYQPLRVLVQSETGYYLIYYTVYYNTPLDNT